MLTAYNSTSTQSVSQPRPKVTLEHQYEVIPCESIGTMACCSESESVLIVLWLTSDFSSQLCGYYLHSGLVIVLIVCTDDEPAGGSEHYVVISGFYEPHLLTYLDEIGINVDCVIQLDSRLTPAKMPPPGIGTSGGTWLS